MLATPFYKGMGLGNQLANYVTVRCLALDKGYTFGVMYPENFKGASFMDLYMGEPVIGGDIPVEGQPPSVLPDGFSSYYREKTTLHPDGSDISGYDAELSLVGDNTLIHGLLQGEKYFSHRLHQVREWLAVKPLKMPDDLCVINFRGGEYKWVKDFFLPQEYWDGAIALMRKENPDMRFEVHTDDPEEARKFFPDFPIVSDMGRNWRSVRYAKWLIISNSSFAILPALLNEDVKRVIAPKYFARRNKGYWSLEQNVCAKFDYI